MLARRHGSQYARGAAQPLVTSSQAPCGGCKAGSLRWMQSRSLFPRLVQIDKGSSLLGTTEY